MKKISEQLVCLFAVSVLIVSASSVCPQKREIESPAINKLKIEIESGNTSAVADFWRGIQFSGTPMSEVIPNDSTNKLVTFIFQDASAKRVRLDSNINLLLADGLISDFSALGNMHHVSQTDLWFLSFRLPKDTRVPYHFQVWSDSTTEPQKKLDPFNKKILWEGSRFSESILELSDAEPQLWVEEREAVKKGEWKELKIQSKALKSEQTVWVYTPADYISTRKEPYDVLIGLDIISFKFGLSADRILDNLTASGIINATVLIAANIGSEESEASGLWPTADFISKEVLPEVRKQFNITKNPKRTIVAGTSKRGLAASYIGLTKPEVAENVLALSAAYYWKPPTHPEYEWLGKLFAEKEKVSTKFYLAVGEFETAVNSRNAGHYMLAANRHMRNILSAKNYEFKYEEFAGVHHELNWRGQLAKGLIYLVGKKKP